VENPAVQSMLKHNEFSKIDRSKLRVPVERQYFMNTKNIDWPPEFAEYNSKFTKLIESIKRRHDPTVTAVAQGVLEWKKARKTSNIGLDMQSWLDRFYMSRIGIRFLIGQRQYSLSHSDYR
jgi:pyruvate dehydrogenase kinase 2/3/4